MRFHTMGWTARTITLALCLGAAVLVSCSKSKDQMVVAKVGDRQITLAQYEHAWFTVDPKYLPDEPDLEGRLAFLETMISKELMAIKSDELGYDKDEFVIKGMEAFRQVGLQAGYLKLKVADKINVTEEDIQRTYENYGRNLRVKQILVDRIEEAEEVYDLLANQGHDFESVCRRYSKGPDAAEGGRVVNALYGTFEPIFQEELFSTPVGGITHPILSRYGYFVIKVVDETKKSKRSFEDARQDVEVIARNQQQIRLQNEMSDDIRERHGFQWYEDNIATTFDVLPPDRPLTNPPNRGEEVYPLLDFALQDLDKPLVGYLGKVITIKDFSDLYDRSSFFQRPRREFRFGGIKKFLMDIVMNELIEVELETSGIENEPEIAAMLNRKKEQLMVDKLYQDLVDNQTTVSYQEASKHYNDNLEQFRRPEERRFGRIVTSSLDSAKEVYEKLRAGGNFERLRYQYTVEEISKDQPSSAFVAKGEQVEIDENGFALGNVGDVSRPFMTEQGWMVLKYFERRPERILPLSEAEPSIKRHLKTKKNEERLQELLAKWRDEVPVEINEKNLMKADLDESLRPKSGVSFS